MKQGKPEVKKPKAPGKRSNIDYRQVSAWVRKDTYKRVKDRLYNKENEREFSELVQALLEDYLKTPLPPKD